MTRFLSSAYLWLMLAACAYAQNATEQPPSGFTESAGMTGVIVFLLLFFGSIGVFGFWIWYRGRKQR